MAAFDYSRLPVNKNGTKPALKLFMGRAGFTNLTDFSKDDLQMMALTWDQENAPRVLGLLTDDENLSKQEKDYLRLKWDPLRKQRQQEKAARSDKTTKKRKHKEDTRVESGPGDSDINNDSDVDIDEEVIPETQGDIISDEEDGSVISTASGRYPMGQKMPVPDGYQGTHKTDDWSMGPDPDFPDHDFTGCLSGHEQVELQTIAENEMIGLAEQEGTTYEPPPPESKWDWREHMEKRLRREPGA